MNIDDASKTLIELIKNLEEEGAKTLIRHRLNQGDDPLTIMEDCRKGMQKVGILYEERRYYLSGLIMAGEIFRDVIELLKPFMKEKGENASAGTILIGTAEGDIHDIGKNIFTLLANCYGFTVHDLGVDVPAVEFLLKAVEIKPQIIGISALLTETHKSVKDTIDLLRSGLKSTSADPFIIVGGEQFDDTVCEFVGANAWTNDAMKGITLCQGFLNS